MGDVYMVNGKILSGLPNHAKDIIFNNDGTTLSSTNTEDAIKEVSSNLTGYPDYANMGALNINTTYTCNADGFILVTRAVTNDSGSCVIVNGKAILALSSGVETGGILFPVKRNDVVVTQYLESQSRVYEIPKR